MPINRTSDFFDMYAHGFNAIYGNKNNLLNNFINNIFRKSMKIRFVKVIEGCEPVEGKSVMDIGCGPGHIGISLAKNGAGYVFGIDFAEGMIELAKENAKLAGVEQRCEFILGDFMLTDIENKFDYSIVMGVMDYIAEPAEFIEKVLSVTRSKAFFSFPEDGGVLAWQRKLRYKKRCDLVMYKRESLNELFSGFKCKDVSIEKISRDFFVTAFME
ncbi:MAG: class I SAM-dependent methyltransferase [Thermodesulfovibrionia bacterium]|nr:class I SAM-dependent methyltransferase [Thermodesulfovibrionia bacterium]